MASFKLDPKAPPRFGAEQRARLDAMTPDEIEAAALADADNPPLTDDELRRMTAARLVKVARAATGLPQSKFATTYKIKLGRLRDLEQGRTEADSAMQAYLRVIARDPDFVRETLKAP
jgi:putative transcriptional regulator